MIFTTKDKLWAITAFLTTLRDIAGCTPQEIERLLDPKMINGILIITTKKPQ